MLYQIQYKHYHLEDNSWEVEHDIKAETPLDAILAFLSEYGDVAPDDRIEALGSLNSALPDSWRGNDGNDATVRELAQAFLDGRCDLEFWPGHSDQDIFAMQRPEPEDTRECPTCTGSGRIHINDDCDPACEYEAGGGHTVDCGITVQEDR